MFHFGSKTINNTSLFGQSTPVHHSRSESTFLLGNTTAMPPLTSSLSSSNLFGTTTILQPTSLNTTTFPKYQLAGGLGKADVQPSSRAKSPEVHNPRPDDCKDIPTLSLSSTFVVNAASTTATSFSLNKKPTTTSAMTFAFGASQPSTSPTLANVSSATTNNTPFQFSSGKSDITTSAASTTPVLFSTMNRSSTSAVDLKLFQTMINTQPFNSEMSFLARNIQPPVDRERARLRTESVTSSSRPKNNPFLSILSKPSVLSTDSPSKPIKRKLADSFLDDEDDHEKYLLLANHSLSSASRTSKIQIKRPRMLDMNKIRSIVLGNNDSINDTSFAQSSITENPVGWKQFPTYEEYLSSKKPDRQAIRLPKLTHSDYYTKPTIEELRSCFNDDGQCFVKEFTVGRKHYGSVTFRGARMNIAGLDLDRLVEIDRRQVTVYPDENDRPVEGEGLNCRAVISLLGVYPIDRSKSNNGEEVTDAARLTEMNYGQYLEGMTKKFHGEFIDYDVETGTWTFQVEHF